MKLESRSCCKIRLQLRRVMLSLSLIHISKAAGAGDVKESLFDQTRGYEADFSKGVYVSVFSGKADDDSRKLKRHVWHIYTRAEAFLDNSTAVSFSGINDAQGNYVACKVLNPSYGDYKDDYADFSYITILVGEDTEMCIRDSTIAVLHLNSKCKFTCF